MTPKELREKRAKLLPRMKELRDAFSGNGNAWKNEDRSNWEAVNKEYNDLTVEIQRAEEQEKIAIQRAEEQEKIADCIRAAEEEQARSAGAGVPLQRSNELRGAQSQSGPTAEQRSLAFQGWCRNQMRMPVTDEHREAARACGYSLSQQELEIAPLSDARFLAMQRAAQSSSQATAYDAMSRALSTGTTSGATGGNLIPEGFVANLETAMLAFGGMLQVADVMTTSSGNDLPWPTANDTGNEGVQLNEATTIGSSVDPTFSQKTFKAWKFSSQPILVSHELLEDSAFRLESILPTMLGERLGRALNRKATTGVGTTTIEGITVGSTLGVTAASATAITFDEVQQLVHSVDSAYRIGARFMMSDSAILLLRTIKDLDGRPIWQPNIQVGYADTLYGYPVTINQHMSTPAAGVKAIEFGRLDKYKIRRVGGVRLYRLQERYRDTDQDAFIAFLRADGGLVDAGTHPVKHLAMAAS